MHFRSFSLCFVWGVLGLTGAPAYAQPNASLQTVAARMTEPLSSALKADAPSQYTIKQGDTLWGIASLYLTSPWRWPDLWRMNRNDIQNPHRIYPGQTLVLSFDPNGQPVLSVAGRVVGGSEAMATNVAYERPTVKISPNLRYETIKRENVVPSIPPAELDPFLSRPLVIESNALTNSPEIILTDDRRVILARGDIAYALGLQDEKMGREWHVYRPNGELRDPRFPFKKWYERSDWYGGKFEPDVGLLGYEAMYLGDARVVQFGDVTKLEIVNAKEEIVPKDRLIVVPPPETISYVPRAPDAKVDTVVIRLTGSVAEAGRGAVVAVASGTKDGLAVGHVISFTRPPRLVPNDKYRRPNIFTTIGMVDPAPSTEKQFYTLPEERIGLGFVFRTFERVSYVYVVSSSAMVRVGDIVRNP